MSHTHCLPQILLVFKYSNNQQHCESKKVGWARSSNFPTNSCKFLRRLSVLIISVLPLYFTKWFSAPNFAVWDESLETKSFLVNLTTAQNLRGPVPLITTPLSRATVTVHHVRKKRVWYFRHIFDKNLFS